MACAGRSADRAGRRCCCGRSAGAGARAAGRPRARGALGSSAHDAASLPRKSCSAKRRAADLAAPRAAPIGTRRCIFWPRYWSGQGRRCCCRRAAGHRRRDAPARTRCAGRAAGGGGDAGRVLAGPRVSSSCDGGAALVASTAAPSVRAATSAAIGAVRRVGGRDGRRSGLAVWLSRPVKCATWPSACLPSRCSAASAI